MINHTEYPLPSVIFVILSFQVIVLGVGQFVVLCWNVGLEELFGRKEKGYIVYC